MSGSINPELVAFLKSEMLQLNLKSFLILFCITFFSSCSSCKGCFQELKGNNIKGKVSFIKTIEYYSDGEKEVKNINSTYYNRNKQLIAEVEESKYQIDSTVFFYEGNCLVEKKNYFRSYRGSTEDLIGKNLLKRDSILKAEDLYSEEYMFLKLHYKFTKKEKNVFFMEPVVERGGFDRKYTAKSRLYKGGKNISQYIYYNSKGEVINNTQRIFDNSGFLVSINYIRPGGYSNYHKIENDSDGNLIIQNGYDGYDDKKTNIRSYQYEYLEFDDYGNWITANHIFTRNNSNSYTNKVKREITYY